MEVLICPECGEKNNHGFVMYYGDFCFNCDFDIRKYVNDGLYDLCKINKKFE